MTDKREKFQEILRKYGNLEEYPDRANVVENAKMLERRERNREKEEKENEER